MLLPIAIITYQLALNDIDPLDSPVEINVAATEATVAKEPTPQRANAITIRNSITDKMITYHKGFFSLTPKFNLFVNDKIIKPGQQLNIPVIDGKINVTYDYNFMGHRKGKKSISFEVPTDKNNLDITFSWKTEPRIAIPGAKALDVKEIY